MLVGVCRLAACICKGFRGLRGRGRAGQALHGFAVEHRGDVAGPWEISMQRGHHMCSPWSTVQTWAAAFTGQYDEAEIDLLLRFADKGTLLLDVGASVGYWAVPLAMAAADIQSRVLAIEPLAANVPLLKANLARNGVDHVVDICRVALGSRRSEEVAVIEWGGVGNASVSPPIPHGDMGLAARWTEMVEVTTLDALDLPTSCLGLRCSVIKLDVEGLEMAVLEGGAGFLTRHRPVLLGEFSPEWFVIRGLPADAPQRWAEKSGYHCYEVVHERRGWLSDCFEVKLVSLQSGQSRGDGALLLTPGDVTGD